MKFSIDKHEKYVLFRLNETKLNSLISPMLKSEMIMINAEGKRNIIIDLTDVSYVDSSGLSSLLVANRLCKNLDGSLILTGLQPALKKLIEITQLENIFKIVPTISEAVDMVFMEEIEKDLKREMNS